MADKQLTAAIIGAGPAGLTCAKRLKDGGFNVKVFDKGKNVGGRLSSREVSEGGTASHFDHGAQFFTVSDPDTLPLVQELLEAGVVVEWKANIVSLENGHVEEAPPATRYVGQPRMASIVEYIGRDLEVFTGTEVGRLFRREEVWRPRSKGLEVGEFDWVVVATPSAQAAQLLWPVNQHLAEWADASTMFPVWALMVTFAEAPDFDFDAAFVRSSTLAWAGRDSSKPGRDKEGQTWVLQANRNWSARHLEDSAESVAEALMQAFEEAVGKRLPHTTYKGAHRWRYAQATDWSTAGYLIDENQQLGVCGDWCIGSRLESAIRSGQALAGRVLGEAGLAPMPSGARQEPLRPDGSMRTAQ